MKGWIKEQLCSDVYFEEVRRCAGFAAATKIVADHLDHPEGETKRNANFAVTTLSTELTERLRNLQSSMHEAYARTHPVALIEVE